MKTERKHWILKGLLIAMLLVAFALRMADLEAVPPGLTHDEAGNGHDSAAILQGVLRIYFPVGYGREPLYHYSVALLTFFLGQSIFTLRLTSVFWSLLTWALTVGLARRWWGQRAALLAGASLTLTFWPLMLARVGLRATTLPPLFAASVLAYERALRSSTRKKALGYYLLAGLLLGLSLYTYMASRGLPFIYLSFLALMAFLNRPTLRRAWRGTLLLIVVAVLIGLPLFLHLRAHPELEYRMTQLGGPLEALKAGDWRPVGHNIMRSLPMLGWHGDPLWLYNIGGRPALELLPALAFWTGVVVALLQLRDRRNALLLLWLGGGLAPAFITGPEATVLRAIAALPPIYLLIALGLDTAWRRTQRWPKIQVGLVLLLSAGLLATGFEASHAYFKTWAENRDVRALYLHHVVALGRALNARTSSQGTDDAQNSPLVLTSIYPGEFHDPYTMEVTLKQKELDIRWANGKGALFIPSHHETRIYTETLSAPQATLRTLVLKHTTLEETLTFRPDDLVPAIYGYRWDSQATWLQLRDTLSHTVYLAPGDPPPSAPHSAAACPITYGDAVSLLGYRIIPRTPYPGDTVEALTAWEVQIAFPAELVLFSHMLNKEGQMLSQADRLDAPSWQWQAQDRFVQVHNLNIPPETPPGEYVLQVGFYIRPSQHTATPPNAQRLLIDARHISSSEGGLKQSGGAAPITRVLIPLKVKAIP